MLTLWHSWHHSTQITQNTKKDFPYSFRKKKTNLIQFWEIVYQWIVDCSCGNVALSGDGVWCRVATKVFRYFLLVKRTIKNEEDKFKNLFLGEHWMGLLKPNVLHIMSMPDRLSWEIAEESFLVGGGG